MIIIFLFQPLPRLLVKTNGMRTDVETKRKMENVRKKGSNLNAKKLAALVEMIVQVRR